MTGKLSIETLSNLLKQEKNLKKKERIQALYWIKSNLVETIENLAALSGKHRTTVSTLAHSLAPVGGAGSLVKMAKFI